VKDRILFTYLSLTHMVKSIFLSLKPYKNILFWSIVFILTTSLLFLSKTEKPKETKVVVEKVTKEIRKTRKYTRYVRLKNDKYDLHRLAAASFGIGIIDNENEINQQIRAGKLVKVKANQGFKIHELTHSKAVLNKAAYNILKEIGVAFSETANDGDYFMVTSLTRPLSLQSKLRKTNINATKGISTHSYGASFDISYVRFNGVKEFNPKLQEMIESILFDYQKAHKIFVLREVKSACYHVTVRK